MHTSSSEINKHVKNTIDLMKRIAKIGKEFVLNIIKCQYYKIWFYNMYFLKYSWHKIIFKRFLLEDEMDHMLSELLVWVQASWVNIRERRSMSWWTRSLYVRMCEFSFRFEIFKLQKTQLGKKGSRQSKKSSVSIDRYRERVGKEGGIIKCLSLILK